ncbi:MAG TPA: radical SAM protein [Candidatus Saccharimonadales bacterium]|nr:radical SAM protein [Candidatus Saccharimonadales bacterium]
MKRKVVLFYPPYDGPPLGAPLCLLSLASPLIDAGFEVSVIDAAINPRWYETVLREASDALCLGISVLTGPMIQGAVRIAKAMKREAPGVPVLFGGWHPSLLPGQTLQEPYVDAVVRGQGELTLLEVAERLAENKEFRDVQGVSSKQFGLPQHAPERRVALLDDLPTPAFQLADVDAYERVSGERKLAYATSVGCPYACNYCTDMVFYKRRFNALEPDRVVREVTELVERYRIAEVAMLDSNLPVDWRRAREIAKGFLDAKVRFRWTFQASTDFLCRMSDDDVRLLGESGVSHMGFGTESTAASVLKLMNKRHQRVDEMYETARKAMIGGIHVTFNLIFGYPGETEADRIETLRTMSDIARQFWNVSFSPNIFTPYPGIPIWPQLREMGLPEPQSLEEWAELPLGRNTLPWLQGKELERLWRMLEFFLLNNQLRKATKDHPKLRSGVRRVLGAPLRWRLRTNKYSFPWELWVGKKIEKVITRRSLVTGQPLGPEGAEAC